MLSIWLVVFYLLYVVCNALLSHFEILVLESSLTILMTIENGLTRYYTLAGRDRDR